MVKQRQWLGSCRSPWLSIAFLLIVHAETLAGEDVVQATTETAPTADQLEFFETRIRPVFAEHCYACHSTEAESLKAGLLVDSRNGLLEGGDSGAAIVPGDIDGSLLVEAVRYEAYEMPPKGKLEDSQIQAIEKWVEMGAPWPTEKAPASGAKVEVFDLQKRKAEHWAWQPIKAPVIPEVVDSNWPKGDLDRFVLAGLEEAKLHPAEEADRSALMRRLYFDLIGLPPTAEEAAEYMNDAHPDATERLVDGLLDSPHFGEHWGRHWLDLVRYAESRGHEFDNDTPNAFQYRDYVIRALNADVPFDQLVREHIAGDLLAEPRLNPETDFNESILGTGFWFLGEWVHSPVDIRKDESDRFDNMIDVMSKAFLGVTVACARCHDHKFDAISTADYYSLSGFLQSSDFRQVRFESMVQNGKVADQLQQLDAKYQAEVTELLAAEGIPAPSDFLKNELGDVGGDLLTKRVVDYANVAPENYIQDGFIFGQQPRLAGEPFLEVVDGQARVRFAERNAATSDPIWNGLESISEPGVADRSRLGSIPRSGRTLRTPTFELTDGRVSCRVRGAGHVVACVDSHRLIAGPLHGETVVGFNEGTDWVELNLSRYVGHRLHLEFTPNDNAPLEVTVVFQGVSQEERKQWTDHEAKIAAAVTKFEAAAQPVLEQKGCELSRAWMEQRSGLQSQIQKQSRLAMAMLDGTGEDDHVLIRGNASKPGPIEPRHFLTALAGEQPMECGPGSGRLELANRITDPSNPLTARVIVNRVWHYLMGRGIVPTTDDFGVLGQLPTDQNLLDHLATRFIHDGQSIKRMIRHVVLSSTYQMSSRADAVAVQADPKNLLWHHRPLKRLERESIRDSLLALSGRLDRTQFGKPVPVHLTAFMDGRGRPGASGPLDGEGRRSIYTAVRRNFLPPFMLTFDTPVPFSTMGRRNVSNVPAQALILLNDPFVVEQAGKWAEKVIAEFPSPPDEDAPGQAGLWKARIGWMYQSAFARKPSDQEMSVAFAFLASVDDQPAPMTELDRLADFAHALINTKEFIFLR